MFFFKKYSFRLDLANNTFRFPDITVQLQPTNGRLKTKMMQLRSSQKTVIPPLQQLFDPVIAGADIGTVIGTTEAFPALERRTQRLVSPALTET